MPTSALVPQGAVLNAHGGSSALVPVASALAPFSAVLSAHGGSSALVPSVLSAHGGSASPLQSSDRRKLGCVPGEPGRDC
jgi:hypothetical protein